MPALLVVVVAALVAAMVVTTREPAGEGVEPDSPARPNPSASPEPGSEPTSASPPTYRVTARPGRPAGAQTSPTRPRAVTLPSGTTVPVGVAETGADGRLRVPADITRAGWWDGGARLGDRYGAMVVASHVDSTTQGLGPFAELLDVTAGEAIGVESSRFGQDYVVDDVELVEQDILDTRDDIFASAGPARLILVTCAGPYLPDEGGYQSLAVVTATPAGPLGS